MTPIADKSVGRQRVEPRSLPSGGVDTVLGAWAAGQVGVCLGEWLYS